ncbi:MAG: hypothetical protein HOQ04_00140, partial [Pseudarthrobacter sp.]|nr:hypothetical protein [Pseudarthrobacter sp.]
SPGKRTTRFSKDTNQAVLGPFTVRDLTVFAATLILFVASLLPIFGARYNLWNLSNLFFLGLGIILPLVVSALFAARRLAPATKIRIGSLSIDQFASVVACFAVAFFFLTVAVAYVHVLLVALIGSVILFAATVLGRFLPYLSGDFQGRPETPAHVVARDAAVPVAAPRAPKQPKPESASHESKSGPKGGGIFGGAGAGSSAVQAGAPTTPSRSTEEPARSTQAPATAAVPTTGPAATAAAGTSTAGTAGAPAPAASAAPAPVSTAPEVADRTPDFDAGPPTQAADVVRPAQVPAASAAAASTPVATAPTAAAAPTAPPAQAADAGPAGPGTAAPRAAWEPPAATAVQQQVRPEEPIGATVDPATRHDEADGHPIHEAFWFAVAQHRTAYDPRTGAPAFVIEPGGWVLALEDRGHEFLVQHTDGRLGVLRDLSNIERG